MAAHVVEFQLPAEAFLIGFGNQIRKIRPCGADGFTLPGSPCSGPAALDRVSFGEPSISPSATLGVVAVAVPMTMVLVQVADLGAHGKDATPACQTVEATLQFGLSIDTAPSVPRLEVSFTGLTAPDLTAQALGALSLVVLGLFPAQSQAFNLAQLGELLGAPPTISGAAIAASADGQRVAVKFALVGGDTLSDAAWAAFAGGSFALPPSAGWTIYLSQTLIEAAVERRMSAGLDKSEADGTIDVDMWPDASLVTLGGVPILGVSFEIEAIDACVCFWGEIDLDVDVTATLTFTVPEPGVLQSDLNLGWDLNDAEVVCCAFTAAMFWPLIGTNLVETGKLSWGEFVGGLFVQPFTFSAFVIAAPGAAEGSIGNGLPTEWEEVDEGTHFRMRSEADLGPVGLDLTLESATVQAGGLVLGGSVGSLGLTLGEPDLSLFVSDFAEHPWGVQNPCDARPDMVVTTHGSVTAVGVAPGTGNPAAGLVPLQVCDMRVIDDPVGQFAPNLTWSDATAEVKVPYDGVLPAYTNDPYPCLVRVHTSAGIRTVSLGPLPPLDDDGVEALLDQAVLFQITKCHQWVDEEFWNARLFLPEWLPDPPPDEAVFQQSWHILITGLADLELVAVQDHFQQPLATLTSLANSPPAVELFADLPARRGDGTGVGLLRTRADAGGRQQIAMQQLVLVRIGAIPVAARILELAVVPGLPGLTVAAATSHGVLVYDLRAPRATRLADFQPIDGLQGVQPWRGGIVAWGGFGLQTLWTGSELPVRVVEPVLGLAVHRGRLIVLDRESLMVFDRDGRPVARTPSAGAMTLTGAADVVAVTTPTELRVLEASTLAALGRVRVQAPEAVAATTYGGARAAFFVRSGDRELVFAVHAHRGPIEVATYARRPLLADALRVRNLFLSARPDDRQVAVYAAGRSVSQRR